MRLIELPTFWTILLDIVIWFVIHMGVVYLAVRIPIRFFNPKAFLYRIRRWEKGGAIYQKFFKIKRWKERAPDGAGFLKERGFPKKRLGDKSNAYLYTFLLETCRAEMTHWIIFLFAPFFFMWNRFWVGVIMIIYAAAENIPLIMIQRYNRARFRRIMEKRGSNL
jgi:glycosyl-4,4'-diaponeurosporenoate acyltransferase